MFVTEHDSRMGTTKTRLTCDEPPCRQRFSLTRYADEYALKNASLQSGWTHDNTKSFCSRHGKGFVGQGGGSSGVGPSPSVASDREAVSVYRRTTLRSFVGSVIEARQHYAEDMTRVFRAADRAVLDKLPLDDRREMYWQEPGDGAVKYAATRKDLGVKGDYFVDDIEASWPDRETGLVLMQVNPQIGNGALLAVFDLDRRS